MARTRSRTRTLTITAAIAAALSALPALQATAIERIEVAPQAKRTVPVASLVAPEPRRRPDGPFMPLIGKPDLGTAENGFGAARSGHVHAGQDILAPAGAPLVAVADGVVADAGSDGGQGNFVHLYDPARERTYVYMHMIEPPAVSAGDRVRAGARLGGVGCTGSCSGDHLHFEVRDGRGIAGEARDPLPLLREWRTLDHPR